MQNIKRKISKAFYKCQYIISTFVKCLNILIGSILSVQKVIKS